MGENLVDRKYGIFIFFILLLISLTFLIQFGSVDNISIDIDLKDMFSITGHSVSDISPKLYSDSIDKVYDSNSVYLWEPSQSIGIKSLALSGQVYGTGQFKAFLISGKKSYLIASMYLQNETINFTNHCQNTCDFNPGSNKKYILRFVVEDVEAKINYVDYSEKAIEKDVEILKELNETKLTISSKPDSKKVKIPEQIENIKVVKNKYGGKVSNLNLILKQKTGIQSENNVYDAELELENLSVSKIEFNDLVIENDTIELGIEDITQNNSVQSYAIDPTKINFTNAIVNSKAKGNVLYICKSWNFSKKYCDEKCLDYDMNGKCNLSQGWKKIMNLEPGKNYSFNLTPEDPAFAEYNSSFEAPFCDNMNDGLCIINSTLLECAGNQNSPGPEPNRPNTIDACAEPGTVGTCRDDESVENITIKDLNNSEFKLGDTIQVNYTVWCWGTVDRVALYYTNSTSSINWRRITSGNPQCSGGGISETFSEEFKLDNVIGTHAIRAINKYNSDITSDCDGASYTDYDDVVFDVISQNEPPTTPTSITCDGGSCNNTFAESVDLQCSGSTDADEDTITYVIDANYGTGSCVNNGNCNSCVDSGSCGDCSDSNCIWSLGSSNSVIYYFNSWNDAGNWDDTSPDEIVDGSLSTSSRDNNDGHYMYVNSNNCSGVDLGTITSVELRVYFENNYDANPTRTIVPRLIPYFGGTTAGDNYNPTPGNYDGSAGFPDWIEWFDITNDANAPGTWTWSDIQNLDCRLESYRPETGRQSVYKIDIRVNYTTSSSCSGILDCTNNLNQTSCNTCTQCDWNFNYSWYTIGNHTNGSIFNWDISSLEDQTNIDLRCRAIDLEGSDTYTDYYDPSINLTKVTQSLVDINLTDPNGNQLNYTFEILDEQNGLYDLRLSIMEEDVSEIIIEDYNQSIGGYIIFESATNELWGDGDYAVQAVGMNYSNMTLIFNSAIGTHLLKCVNWSMSNLNCTDPEGWDTVQLITPGVGYNLTLTEADPGFVELTVPNQDNLNDGYADEENPGLEYGARNQFRVANYTGGNQHPMIMWNLSSIPQGVIIDEANLTVRCTGESLENGESIEVGVHRVYSNFTWTEGTGGNGGDACAGNEFCWNNKPSQSQYNNTAESTNVLENGCSGTFYIFNVTEMIKSAYANNEPNISIYLVPTGINVGNVNNDRVRLNSKDSAAARRPRLNIKFYTIPDVNEVLPTAGTKYNYSDAVNISANVTDLYPQVNISTVLANITKPGNNVEQLVLTNVSDIYSGSFTNTTLLGTYTVRIIATNTDGYVNKSETTTFIVVDDENPNVTLNYPPIGYVNDSDNPLQLEFNCSVTDNYNLSNISLYITDKNNQSFTLNQTNLISGITNETVFTKTLARGNYTWNCLAYDTSNNSDWGINRTIKLNGTLLNLAFENITAEPDPNGFDYNTTITANITDASFAKVGISYENESEINYSMSNLGNNIFQYDYSDWRNGTYYYVIYASSDQILWHLNGTYNFSLYQNISLQVKTMKDAYAENEIINITDPAEIVYPEILTISLNPSMVNNGEKMDVNVEVIDKSGIDNIKIFIPTEVGEDEIDLVRTQGTKFNGVWETTWTAHDLLNTSFHHYIARIVVSNNEGMQYVYHSSIGDPPSFWIYPTTFEDPSGQWSGETNAFDGDEDTYASDNSNSGIGWGEFIIFNTSEIRSDKVRIWSDYGVQVDAVDIDVFKDGSWVDAYEGAVPNLDWFEANYTIGNVTAGRYRFSYTEGGWIYWLYEFQFYNITSQINKPVAVTSSASSIEENYATLRGKVLSDGGDDCDVRFIYGKTQNYENSTTWDSDYFSGDEFSEKLMDLELGQKYYFKAQVRNSVGTTNGSESSFTTQTPGEEWVSPTGFNDPLSEWQDGENVLDDLTSTRASLFHEVNDPNGQWSPYLYLNRTPSVLSDRVRFYAKAVDTDAIDIDLYNGSWFDVYNGSFSDKTWIIKYFNQTNVTQARVRLRADANNKGFEWHFYEFDFYKLGSTPEEEQSKLENNLNIPASCYLNMKTQFWNGSTWYDEDVIINFSSPLQIGPNYKIKLDLYWNNESYSTSNLSNGDGIYRIYASCLDNESNILLNLDGTNVTASYNFTYDSSNPEVIIVSPLNNSNYSLTSSVPIRSNVTDFSGIDYVQANISTNIGFEIVNLEYNTTSGLWETDYDNTNYVGEYNIRIIAYDNSGSYNDTEEVMINVIDDLSPEVFLIYPEDNYYNESLYKVVNFRCNITDNYDAENISLYITDNNNTNFEINQTDFVSGVFTYALYQLNLSTGTYTWNCLAYDSSGNFNWGVNRSINIGSVPNTAPNTTIQVLNSTNLQNKTTENLTCYARGKDSENTTLKAYYKWYNNSVLFSEGVIIGISNGTLSLITTLDSSNTEKSETWTCSILFGDGELNESGWNNKSLTILNSLPSTPDLFTPLTNFTTINRTPELLWNASFDADNDNITYEIVIVRTYCQDLPECTAAYFNITTQDLNLTPPILDVDAKYNWSVRACDDEGCSPYSETRNFTINSLIAISLPVDSVEFGLVENGDINNTADNLPPPLIVQNDGNIICNVTFYANESLWTRPYADLNTSYFIFKIDNSTELNSFDYGQSQTTFINVTDYEITSVVDFEWETPKDSAEIDLGIEVPIDESAGTKQTNVYVVGK